MRRCDRRRAQQRRAQRHERAAHARLASRRWRGTVVEADRTPADPAVLGDGAFEEPRTPLVTPEERAAALAGGGAEGPSSRRRVGIRRGGGPRPRRDPRRAARLCWGPEPPGAGWRHDHHVPARQHRARCRRARSSRSSGCRRCARPAPRPHRRERSGGLARERRWQGGRAHVLQRVVQGRLPGARRRAAPRRPRPRRAALAGRLPHRQHRPAAASAPRPRRPR